MSFSQNGGGLGRFALRDSGRGCILNCSHVTSSPKPFSCSRSAFFASRPPPPFFAPPPPPPPPPQGLQA